MKWCMQNVWPEKSREVGLIDEDHLLISHIIKTFLSAGMQLFSFSKMFWLFLKANWITMRKTCESTDFVNFSFATNIESGSMNDKEGQRKTTEAYIFWTP